MNITGVKSYHYSLQKCQKYNRITAGKGSPEYLLVKKFKLKELFFHLVGINHITLIQTRNRTMSFWVALVLKWKSSTTWILVSVIVHHVSPGGPQYTQMQPSRLVLLYSEGPSTQLR